MRVPWTIVIMTLKRMTADSQEVLSFVSAAQAPSKYKILESCPSLETEENMRELIGVQILHAWAYKDRQGWFEGRVHGRNLNARDLARAPIANFSVRYPSSVTSTPSKLKTTHACTHQTLRHKRFGKLSQVRLWQDPLTTWCFTEERSGLPRY